ncbi:MAG TPA: hypothetical protein VHC39_08225 [Rhizomicrobium sp.]|nr:hypothetical protein [Rhizomicrobium sp.]
MATASESPLAQAQVYRARRRAFIAACEAAGVDTIARLHPARPADSKPLFMDSAALGPRLAQRAVLAVARDAQGSDILIGLLKAGLKPPREARLVLVHACDPAFFAAAAPEPEWPAAMLGAVATEDLSRVRALAVLPLAMPDDGLIAALAARLPDAIITLLPQVGDDAAAKSAIAGFLAQ